MKKRKSVKNYFTPKPQKYRFFTHPVHIGQFLFLSIFLFVLPSHNIYQRLIIHETDAREIPIFSPSSPAPYPTNINGYYPDTLTAEGIVVVDSDSAVILYEKNADKQMAPASITKMMTALVALDAYSLDDVIKVQTVITEGRTMGLVSNEEITVENLLYGMLVHSGNDAAYVLAQQYPAGFGSFIAAMNAKAKELGLTSTHFTNPMGFDDFEQYSTPRDLLRLAQAVLSHKELTKIVSIPNITVSDVSHSLYHHLTNVNELVGKIPGVSGIKTGLTEQAGESLVSVVERGGHRVFIVLLRSKNRFKETEEIINWVFSSYRWEEIKPPT